MQGALPSSREYTTARGLVMEYVGGIPIDDGPALAEQGYVEPTRSG